MIEYVVDFGDKSSAFVGLAMAEAESHGATLKERIVRCRDCVHCREHDMRAYGSDRNRLLCHHFSMSSGAGWPVEPDGFCAWGERRDV